jgi:hypothetical protein
MIAILKANIPGDSYNKQSYLKLMIEYQGR